MVPFPARLRKLLIRSTNWIGDAVMTTPAIRAIRRNFPEAEITLLALPWVADIFAASPHIDHLMLYERQGRHQGLAGKVRLAADLRSQGFDGAILLQNAFEAAFITALARIPARGGYTTDGRRLLLTHGVRRDRAILSQHQVQYYLAMLQGLGLDCGGPDTLELFLPAETEQWAAGRLAEWRRPGSPVIGLNPGAAYGPAKRWPGEKYARLAEQLAVHTGATLLIFGTGADQESAAAIRQRVAKTQQTCLDLTGRTTLAEAMALIRECDLFITNDSGLMHVAAALGTSLVAIFGSTDHLATGPYCSGAAVVRRELACSPCKKTHCPEGHFRCMEEISVQEVVQAGLGLLDQDKGEPCKTP